MTVGAVLFARYAYPPNALGYCGPDAAGELLELADAGAASPELRRLARGFEGAWPYLELIAHANGRADPLDADVVEAYWLGNALLDAVNPRLLHTSLDERFRPRQSASGWAGMDASFGTGLRPHHCFHVLWVYPWLGLLRGGRVDEPLRVLDRCRIRWGRVLDAGGGGVLVESRPLTWDGVCLGLGEPVAESVRAPVSWASGRPGALRTGEWVSLHWDWICQRLDASRLASLRQHTRDQLVLVNAGVPLASRPALAALEG